MFRRTMLVLSLAVVLFAVPAMALMQAPTPTPPENLVTYLIALGTSFVLALVKKFTTAADTWIGLRLKSIQPLIVLAATVGLPLLWNVLHLSTPVPDAAIFASAPLATIIAVVAAEILKRLTGGTPAPVPVALGWKRK